MPDVQAPPLLALHLLQTPRLVLGDGTAHVLERKDAALLAMLAIDGPWPAARAAGLLWPDSPERQARTNLRQRLFRLRRLAGTEVVHAHGSLQLAPGLDVDVLCLAEALADRLDAGDGDLLGSHDYADAGALERWVIEARQRWRDRRQHTLAARAAELEAGHEIAAALVLARRLVADDPLQEHAHRRLMRLHYLRGDRAAALAAYQQCRETLAGELSARPDHETQRLAALIESSGTLPQPAPRPRAIATLRPPRLVGREGPWLRLERALREGASALVEGEAGIGKSRLLGDFAAAHGGAPVFGARPGDVGLPYALLARIVRGLAARGPLPGADWVQPELARVAPELGTPAAGQPSKLRVQQALRLAFDGWQADGLALVVVDDLHHADDASLELLPALVTGGSAPGIAWLLGVRRGEVPASARAWLDAPEGQALDRIALDPLDPAGVERLLESLALPQVDAAAWAPALARHTGGNPLFVLETLIALGDRAGTVVPDETALPAPERIVRLVEHRLSQLGSSALRLARVAAVAGQDFSAALAARVLGQRALDIADAWRELEDKLVIRGDAFAHDLIAEGTLRSIPQPVARLLHRDVAAALQAAGAPPARLGAHWAAAQEWRAAAEAYVAAARAAFAAGRRVEESQWWDEAVRCFERAGDIASAFEARRDGIDTLLATRPPRAVLVLTESLLHGATGDRQRLDALIAHGKALQINARHAEAVAAADEAATLALRADGPWPGFGAACLAAMTLSPGPRAAEGIERLRAFATLVETDGNPQQRRDYYGNLVVALHLDQRRVEAAAVYPLAVRAARDVGDTSEELTCTSNMAGLLAQLGRVEESHALAERACRLLEQMGNPDGLGPAAALNMLALANTTLGRLDLALLEFERALAKLGGAGGSEADAKIETAWANCWLQLGQPARALQVLRPIAEAVAARRPELQGRRLTIHARIDHALCHSALPRLQQAVAAFGGRGDPMLRMLADLDLSRETDDTSLALAACERVQRDAEAAELAGTAMRARLLAIEARIRAGDIERAAADARSVQQEWRACRPADLYWPDALAIVHRAFDGVGETTAADAVLDEAVAWIRDTAQLHVPAPFLDGFLHRNPVNRALLAAAGRR